MDLAARPARAGVAHHPEIVLLAAVDDVDFGVEAGGAEFLRPELIRFLIEVAGVALWLYRANKPWRKSGSLETSKLP